MIAKRFRVNELVKYNYSDIGEYIDENHTDKPLRNDELVEFLNELYEENILLRSKVDDYYEILEDVFYSVVSFGRLRLNEEILDGLDAFESIEELRECLKNDIEEYREQHPWGLR